jgi:hypothetical protein
MKDEIHIERCSSILDLKLMIDDYMDYYNNDRYQWGLAKLSPNQYVSYLKTSEYPINIKKIPSYHNCDIRVFLRLFFLNILDTDLYPF